MADSLEGGAGHPKLNLSAEEKRVYGQLFRTADPDGFGAVSGDVAVTFFDRTKLPSDVLGQIWQIADSENRGLLTPSGFSVVLRLIGHAQAGRVPTPDLASQTGPLPRFDGIPSGASGKAAQTTGPSASPTQSGPPPIRVPPLSPEKVNEFSSLFEKSGAESGLLSGIIAKQIFERARLPNEVLGRIWNLADTQGRGALDITEFAIAMHLLASYKSGTMRGVPQNLPSGLYEAAAKRAPIRLSTGTYSGNAAPPVPGIPPQFTGMSAGRPQSPVTRSQVRTPLSAQSTGDGWAVSPADKARFDQIFAELDKSNRGFITGDQAVEFFGNARLPEEVLAQIWDLANISSEGQLNRDEFAVAMYLIRQQRGTKEGRGNLPSTLPPALIPPMMRKHQAPPQPTAPAFENAPVTKSRSAADDLFGLDAFSSAPPQAPQSTGDSITGGPFENPASPPPPATTASPGPSTNFKPFIPSSSFGQSLAPQQTGISTASQPRTAQLLASDDLLGDADPEVSQKLTSETSELANLSNQVGNLSRQMQEVQGTRGPTEQEFSQGSQQKKEFELRLSQLRTMYEKEVQDVKTLQEQLSTQRNQVENLQKDIAMLEAGLHDLQSQHQQLSTALEAELREKASLNDRIKATNTEMNELKPRVEKMKSEARQQKGLVAISKKQLATVDAERDRLRNDLDTAKVDLEAAKREAEEQARSASQTPSVANPVNLTSPIGVASPASSVMSATNPFFRRGTGTSEATFSPPAPSREQTVDRESAFESLFGPSFASPSTGTPPPLSSKNVQSIPSREAPQAEDTPPAPSPPSNETSPAGESPVPPQFRQITSAALPFRVPLERTDSINSSVKVVPPASRLSPADTPRAVTPSASASSTFSQNGESPGLAPSIQASGTYGDLPPSPHSEHPTPTIPAIQGPTVSEELNMDDSPQDVPGAFPAFETPNSETPPKASMAGVGAAGLAAGGAAAVIGSRGNENSKEVEKKSNNLDTNFDHYFGGPAHSRSPSEKAADFDSAFANLKQPTTNGTASEPKHEFPPIRELDVDDSDDSSDARTGFDDDFAPASPPRLSKEKGFEQGKPGVASAIPTFLQPRPPFNTVPSNNSSLPEIEAQTSPPSYGESVPRDNPNHFPPEYKGLLPQRGDPTSSEHGPFHSVQHDTGIPASRTTSQSYGPETTKSPPNVPGVGLTSAAVPPKQNELIKDDFDAAFADMAPAPVVDDDDDDDVFDTTFAHNHGTEFDSTFDSPAPSKSTTMTVPPQMASSSHFSITTDPSSTRDMKATNEFYNFSSDVNDSQSSAPTAQPAPINTATTLNDTDWDDMFSALDKPPPTISAPPTNPAEEIFSPPPGPPPSNVTAASTSAEQTIPSSFPLPPKKQDNKLERPVPGRALTIGTEHDDPILKRLTAMGWSRDESLKALEEFDYNIDKAADYLTFKS